MRHLQPALRQYLDSRIGAFVPASPTDLLIHAAMACVGITEEGADNHGRIVELFQSTVGVPAGQSWCMDFIQSLIAYVEVSQRVESAFPASESCLRAWQTAPLSLRLPGALPGSIAIWEHGETGLGHTGLVVEVYETSFKTIEGNTGPGAGIERNGDGVYTKSRLKGGSKTFKEVGFLSVW